MTTEPKSPVQEKPSDEAKAKNLPLAKEQGEAYQKGLKAMGKMDAHGQPQQVEDYLVNYMVEEAEGLYFPVDGKLEWREPGQNNTHLEIAVSDAGDKRFIPGLTIHAALLDAKGQEVVSQELPFLWHPWLYHYGADVKVPSEGEYTLRVHIDMPTFPRHDKTNGNRFTKPVDVEFQKVKIETGKKKSKVE